MKENEQASLSIKKIALITIMLIFILGIGVRATTTSLNTVKIILSDNYEIEVITTKKVVSEILEENHIIVLPTETVFPSLDAEITNEDYTITITSAENPTQIVSLANESENVSIEQILSNYSPIVEKMVTGTEIIQYDSVDEEGNIIDFNNTTKYYKTKKSGKLGRKQVVYRIKYQNDIEIERTAISESIIQEPVSEVVTETTEVSSRNATSYRNTTVPVKSTTELAKSVEGIQPKIRTLNASAYTASTCGKSPSSPTYGITSSGEKATSWYTVAAGSAYPIGTVIYIPYFANKANGGWFVVQDRGGAISNNKIDVYMDTYTECQIFGRRNLECYIYVP